MNLRVRRTKLARRFALILGMGLFISQVPALVSAQLVLPRYVCGEGFGAPISAIGPRSQTLLHYRLFISRFHAPAQRNDDGTLSGAPNYDTITGGCRDDVQGLIGFNGQNEDTVLRSMIWRRERDGIDGFGRAYRFYGLNRPLSPVEQYRIESEVETLRSDGTPYDLLHMPIWIDGVAIAYNLSCPTGNPGNELRLTSRALSGIFSGTLARWKEDLITATNPKLTDCRQFIRPSVRADVGEQTTVFKDYLSKRNPEWRLLMESQLNTTWPATLNPACRGRGDEGMATCVSGVPGAIGYLRFPEALALGLRTASVENRGLEMVPPSLEGCTAAATSPSANIPRNSREDWSNTSLTDPVDTPGRPSMYAICSLQYLLAFEIPQRAYERSQRHISEPEIRTLKDYLRWTLVPATQDRLATFQLAKLPNGLRLVSIAGVNLIRE